MNPTTVRNWAIAIGAIVLLIIAWKLFQWFKEKGIGGVAKDSASATVEAVGGLATGAVLGVARTIGIPDTNADKCAEDIKTGSWFSASIDCPADVFTKSVFNRIFSTEPLTGTTK